MPYEANLYKRTPQVLGAPKLEPKTNQNEGSTHFSSGIPGLVDIHRAYRWTLSQPVAREIVPMLQLTEYKLVLSSEVSGFLYMLRGEADNLNVIKQEFAPNVERTGTAIQRTGGAIASSLQSLLGNLQDAVKAADANQEVLNKASKQDAFSGVDDQSGLKPYLGLYAMDPTGWSYNLPYLGPSNMASPNNQWGESTVIQEGLKKAGGGILNFFGGLPSSKPGTTAPGAAGVKGSTGGGDISKLAGGLKDFYTGATTAALSLGGGLVSRETPQSFTGTDSDKIDVSFYLLNTHDVKDIRRNWEFCYLLTYQNLANRKGINLLDPPCLYSATIAGYKQLPICWVTNFQVTNVGTTRLIDITTGEIDERGAVSPYIKKIPEAYRISFTLQSSLKNARNIFQFVEDPSYKVSVRGV
jgi:hypothetical protein